MLCMKSYNKGHCLSSRLVVLAKQTYINSSKKFNLKTMDPKEAGGSSDEGEKVIKPVQLVPSKKRRGVLDSSSSEEEVIDVRSDSSTSLEGTVNIVNEQDKMDLDDDIPPSGVPCIQAKVDGGEKTTGSLVQGKRRTTFAARKPVERSSHFKSKFRRLERSETTEQPATAVASSTDKGLDALKAAQSELEGLEVEAVAEYEKLKVKYDGLRKGLMDKRVKIAEQLPKFWMKAFMSHPEISKLLTDEEQRCLRFLRHLDVQEEGEGCYRIVLNFEKNPYFTNTQLLKELNDIGGVDPRSSSTKIIWEKNMQLTSRRSKKQTFFSWFNDNANPNADETAQVLRNEVWKNPLRNFPMSAEDESSQESSN